MSDSNLTHAVVLVDIAAHGLKAGQILEASRELVQALKKDGSVDAHKDALAYAHSQGAAVARSAVETRARERAAAVDAMRVEIAKLEDLHAKADGDTKTALAAELLRAQASLAELAAS